MKLLSKIEGYTLIELLIVMALSIIIISMIFLALFLIQKQIEANKDHEVYDQALFLNILDHHLFECEDVDIVGQTMYFNYAEGAKKISLSEQYVYLSENDSLKINAKVQSVKKDEVTGLLDHFQLAMRIRNEQVLLYKKADFSSAYILNNKYINFEY